MLARVVLRIMPLSHGDGQMRMAEGDLWLGTGST